MPNINALIARGGGYQPPSFDYNQLQQHKADMETRGLQNQLLRGQVAAQPEQQNLERMRMQLQQDLLNLEKFALKLSQKGELKPIITQITAGEGELEETYELSGGPEAVALVAGEFGRRIDHLDEQAIPWAASQGVGIKKVEDKGPVPGTQAYLDMFEDKKKIEAKYRQRTETKDIITWKGPNGEILNLEKGTMPPADYVRYKDDTKPDSKVTWTTATNNLSKRFGSYDKVGNIVITQELQNRHKLAQKKLVELKNTGIEPLAAINQAEDYANRVEENYHLYLEAAKSKEQKQQVQDQFKARYGYIP